MCRHYRQEQQYSKHQSYDSWMSPSKKQHHNTLGLHIRHEINTGMQLLLNTAPTHHIDATPTRRDGSSWRQRRDELLFYIGTDVSPAGPFPNCTFLRRQTTGTNPVSSGPTPSDAKRASYARRKSSCDCKNRHKTVTWCNTTLTSSQNRP